MQIVYRIYVWLFVIAFYLLYFYSFSAAGIYKLQHDPQAMDFLAFYTGAKLLSVAPTDTYNLHSQLFVQQQSDPVTKTAAVFLPFINPPIVALAVMPLITLGLANAYILLLAINLIILLLICLVFLHQNKRIKWYFALSFIIGTVTFIPLLITLFVGQLSIIYCVIFLSAWLLLKDRREFLSGLILSLIFIKPQFFLLPLLAILIQRRKNLLAGFIIGTACLLGISYFCVGWTGTNNYVMLLTSLYKTGTGYTINLMAQQSLQTLLLIVFHTQILDQIRPFWIIAVLGISIPTLFVWSKKFPVSSPEISLQFALLIIATLLISPHTHFYDVSLLVVVSFLLLSQLHAVKPRQKKLFIYMIIFSYCVPLFGYCLFAWTQNVTQGIWVIPTVVYLIIYWVLLFRTLLISRNRTGLQNK